MASNLACVGLAVEDRAAMDWLLDTIEPDSRVLGRSRGIEVRRWEDPSGARLVFNVRRGEVVGFLPSFAAPRQGARLAGIGFVSEDVASVDIVDDHGELMTRATVELEQRHLLQARGAPRSGRAAIVALGIDVEVFDDAAAFADSPASLLSDDPGSGSEPPARAVEAGLKWPPRLATQSFMSYGMFAPDDEVTAHARLSGTVIEASTRTVTRTGQRFVAARLALFGFEAALCLPADAVASPPRTGNVVHGTVFLVGDVDLPAPAVAARPRPWWRRRPRP